MPAPNPAQDGMQQRTRLHQRYVEVSNRFRSAWTYHQFLLGLRKLEGDAESGAYAGELEATHEMLKQVSEWLNSSDLVRAENQLGLVDRKLDELYRLLAKEDTKISPSRLRVFFERIRNHTDKILRQLVFFFVHARKAVSWNEDHADKVDYLLTKLAGEAQGSDGPWVLRDRPQLREFFHSLWEQVGDEVESEEFPLQARVEQLESFRREIGEVESFDQLIDEQTLVRYRGFKHQLGIGYFHPELTMGIVEANLQLRNAVQRLHRREEQSIVADYQRIFDLERQVEVGEKLDEELTAFRDSVERFESKLQRDELSIDELARVREKVRQLIPRLTGAQLGTDLGSDEESEEEVVEFTSQPTDAGDLGASLPSDADHAVLENMAGALGCGWGEELLAPHLGELLDALDGTDWDAKAEVVTFSTDLYPYQLEGREVEAYRRLAEPEGEGDRDLEAFLLWATALRVRTLEEIDEIHGILDDTAVTREAPVFGRARRTLRLGDLMAHRFEHETGCALTEGEHETAADLQLLRVRLLREWTGLWLLVHKPM